MSDVYEAERQAESAFQVKEAEADFEASRELPGRELKPFMDVTAEDYDYEEYRDKQL